MTSPTTSTGTKSWAQLREERKPNPEKVAEYQKQMIAEMRAYRLAEIRKQNDITQEVVADRIGVSQRRVSRIEHGDLQRTQLATVKSYVEALGGTLEVVARFGDAKYTVS